MKQILIILGLFASVSTFAQSPRIKLNQITKDTVKGSVLISSPSDSGMVYSRDFYVAYGSDTVLILYGDTLAATSGIISSVLSDGVTITGNGTSGNELKVDTSLIATIKALNDTLATISASTTPDGVTITGDGSVGNPLKVDTATVISTIQGLVDTLTNRGYLTANQTITISGDVTGSGTTSITATVVDDSHDHIISNVDFLQDSLTAKANASELSNYVTIVGTETITGAKSFSANTNFDSGTLYVDATNNRVGIGTTSPSPSSRLFVVAPTNAYAGLFKSDQSTTLWYNTYSAFNLTNSDTTTNNHSAFNFSDAVGGASSAGIGVQYVDRPNNYGDMYFYTKGTDGYNHRLYIESDGNVGIGTSTPDKKLHIKGDNTSSDIVFETGPSYTTKGYFAHYQGATLQLAINRDITGVFSNTGAAAAGINLTGNNGDGNFTVYTSATNNTSPTLGLKVDKNQNVGIGNIFTPSEKLDVNGNARFRSIGSGASSGALHYTSTGVLTTNTSDARLKTNLQPLDNTLNKLLGINTYTFNWIDETDRVDLGMIAQEVEQIFPNLVFTNSVDGYKGIHYDKFSSILTKAIQEQQAIILTQEQKITDLETTIQSLITRIEILENK